MGGKFKRRQQAVRAHDSANEKKTTVVAARGPTGAMYTQGIAKDTANFYRTNQAMVEYVGILLGPVTSRVVRTLTKLVNEIWEKPKRMYHSVAPTAAAGVNTYSQIVRVWNLNH